MILSIVQKLPRARILNVQFMQRTSQYTTKTKDEHDEKEPPIPVNLLKDVYGATNQPGHGFIYDKKPIKYRLEANKDYNWCSCGRSKSQPFCDGTHRNPFWKITMKPVRLRVSETKDYWLCNCKQTKNRPFCDGSHLQEDIQSLRR